MSVDMSKVKVGTRVRYSNGKEAVITEIDNFDDEYLYRTDKDIWHKPDGTFCFDTWPEDIVEIIDDVKPQQQAKRTHKRSAPLYSELLNERELLKMENHNLKVQLDTVKNATLFGLLAWWFGNRRWEWK